MNLTYKEFIGLAIIWAGVSILIGIAMLHIIANWLLILIGYIVTAFGTVVTMYFVAKNTLQQIETLFDQMEND